jgi:hypothetical protein
MQSSWLCGHIRDIKALSSVRLTGGSTSCSLYRSSCYMADAANPADAPSQRPRLKLKPRDETAAKKLEIERAASGKVHQTDRSAFVIAWTTQLIAAVVCRIPSVRPSQGRLCLLSAPARVSRRSSGRLSSQRGLRYTAVQIPNVACSWSQLSS